MLEVFSAIIFFLISLEHASSVTEWLIIRLKTPVISVEHNRLLEISLQSTYLSQLLRSNSNFTQTLEEKATIEL